MFFGHCWKKVPASRQAQEATMLLPHLEILRADISMEQNQHHNNIAHTTIFATFDSLMLEMKKRLNP